METNQETEFWKEVREESRKKKRDNEQMSLHLLKMHCIEYEILCATVCHYRVGPFDYWPTTGKFYNQKTGEFGRGVKNLIKRVKKIKHEQQAQAQKTSQEKGQREEGNNPDS